MALDTEERTLYVSNLDRNVTEELLYELFLQAGPIERVNIPRDRDFGFITYKHESSIEYAIELFKGTRLFKKELQIKKKGERSNNQENQNNQQMNNFMRGVWDQNMAMAMNLNQFNPNQAQAQIAQLLSLSSQFMGANVQNFNSQNNRNHNFNEDNSKGHWSNRSRPYDRNSRNYSARSREPRDRNNKGRDYSNNSYRDRNRKY